MSNIKASDHASYGVVSIVSLLVPVAGLIIGAIYITNESPVNRKLGEHAIAVSVLGIILSIVFWMLWINGLLMQT